MKIVKRINKKRSYCCMMNNCNSRIGLGDEMVVVEIDNNESTPYILFHYDCFIRSVLKAIPEIKVTDKKKRMQIVLEEV